MKLRRRRHSPGIGVVLAVLLTAGFSPVATAADAGGSSDGASSGASVAPARASLEQSLDAPDTPRSGDPLELQLEVEHPPGADVRVDPGLETSRWQLVDRRKRQVGSEGDPATALTLTLQVFRVGETTLEPFDVVVAKGDDRRTVLQTEPVTLHIESVLQEDDPSFRPARPTRPVWIRDYTWAWVGGSAVVGLAFALLALLWFRSREDRSAPAPRRPPEEVALERLESLGESSLLERGEFMLFYVRMSAAVRRYLGERFGFPGVEWTTAEILERLEHVAWAGDVTHAEIADWMRRIDLVKFSGRIPSTEEARRALDLAIEIVRKTEPPRVEPEESRGEEASTATDGDAGSSANGESGGGGANSGEEST